MNLYIDYNIPNNLLLHPVLRQCKAIHTLTQYFFKIKFNIIPQLRPGLQ
jgi:hypothetical protein